MAGDVGDLALLDSAAGGAVGVAERSECPESSVGRSPAAVALRVTISATDWSRPDGGTGVAASYGDRQIVTTAVDPRDRSATESSHAVAAAASGGEQSRHDSVPSLRPYQSLSISPG